MEMDIRPVIWSAEFLKMEKILYDAIKWADYVCVLYFSQFLAKNLIFLKKKNGHLWHQALYDVTAWQKPQNIAWYKKHKIHYIQIQYL